MEYLLETDNITKRYGQLTAVDHVTLHLEKGEIYGLIGRNGAGKTTLLKMLAGLAKPTEGSFSIFGETAEATVHLRDRIGVLIESPGLYPSMSAFENMKVKALMLGMNDDDFLNELLSDVGLEKVGKRKVRQFSLGMKQRLGIAMTLIGHPDLLLLDEPAAGMNPNETKELMDTIALVRREFNMTILLIEHDMKLVSGICEKLTVLNFGRVLCQGDTKDVLNNPEVITAYLGE